MNHSSFPGHLILAELLRIQRWAGGDSISASRIFGLMHGFETVIREESDRTGLSREIQEKVENLLEDVDHEKQSTDGMAIKDRLRQDGIDETEAAKVLEFCRLQSRFGPAIKKLIAGRGSVFSYLKNVKPQEHEWFGALHYMELVDCTGGSHNKMHAIFSPSVPRVGESIIPQRGSVMRVVGVEYQIVSQGEASETGQNYLVPHVLLEEISEDAQ